MLGVVRPIGMAGACLPVAMCTAYATKLHSGHRMALPDSQVDPSSSHVFSALAASADPVALLPLPTERQHLEALRPLVRGAVLPLYPPGLWGPEQKFGSADTQFAAVEAWGASPRNG